MNLTDTMSKSMNEILAECEVIDQKVHTDDSGEIQAIEIKYRPKGTQKDLKVPSFINNGGH